MSRVGIREFGDEGGISRDDSLSSPLAIAVIPTIEDFVFGCCRISRSGNTFTILDG